jgi:hypothetical protein
MRGMPRGSERVCDDRRVGRRIVDLAGPVLCLAAAACMFAGLAVDIGSDAAKGLIAAAGILFVPGAILTLIYVRRIYGPGP